MLDDCRGSRCTVLPLAQTPRGSRGTRQRRGSRAAGQGGRASLLISSLSSRVRGQQGPAASVMQLFPAPAEKVGQQAPGVLRGPGCRSSSVTQASELLLQRPLPSSVTRQSRAARCPLSAGDKEWPCAVCKVACESVPD